MKEKQREEKLRIQNNTKQAKPWKNEIQIVRKRRGRRTEVRMGKEGG